ncbi:hypothetical protein [Staphylococcus sp. 11261D007BR]
MKKFLVLIPIMAIILTACTTGALRKAQGEWENNSDEDMKLKIIIKDDQATMSMNGMEMELPDKIKKSDKNSDLLVVNFPDGSNAGEQMYLKPDGDRLMVFDDPDDDSDDAEIFNKVK